MNEYEMKAAIIEILSGGTGSYTKDEYSGIYSNIVPGCFNLQQKASSMCLFRQNHWKR